MVDVGDASRPIVEGHAAKASASAALPHFLDVEAAKESLGHFRMTVVLPTPGRPVRRSTVLIGLAEPTAGWSVKRRSWSLPGSEMAARSSQPRPRPGR